MTAMTAMTAYFMFCTCAHMEVVEFWCHCGQCIDNTGFCGHRCGHRCGHCGHHYDVAQYGASSPMALLVGYKAWLNAIASRVT